MGRQATPPAAPCGSGTSADYKKNKRGDDGDRPEHEPDHRLAVAAALADREPERHGARGHTEHEAGPEHDAEQDRDDPHDQHGAGRAMRGGPLAREEPQEHPGHHGEVDQDRDDHPDHVARGGLAADPAHGHPDEQQKRRRPGERAVTLIGCRSLPRKALRRRCGHKPSSVGVLGSTFSQPRACGQVVLTVSVSSRPACAVTSTSRPRFVSRIVYGASAPSSFTLFTVVPAGSVCPMVSATPLRWAFTTVVVSVADTSTEPSPSRMFLPAMPGWPGGTCGVTSSAPLPRSGRTPSCWCTTVHTGPYAPHACMTIARS